MNKVNYYNIKYKGKSLNLFCLSESIDIEQLIKKIKELKNTDEFKNFQYQHLISQILEGDTEEVYNEKINKLLFKKYCLTLNLPYNKITNKINSISKTNPLLSFKDINSIDIFLNSKYQYIINDNEKFIEMYTREIKNNSANIEKIKILKTKNKYKIYSNDKLMESVLFIKKVNNKSSCNYKYKNVNFYNYAKINNLSYSYIIDTLNSKKLENSNTTIESIIENHNFNSLIYLDKEQGALDFIKKYYSFININLFKVFFIDSNYVELLKKLENYHLGLNNTLYELYAIYKSNLYQSQNITNDQLFDQFQNYIFKITKHLNISNSEYLNFITVFLDKDAFFDEISFKNNLKTLFLEYITNNLDSTSQNYNNIYFDDNFYNFDKFSELNLLTKEELSYLKLKLKYNLTNFKIAKIMKLNSLMVNDLESSLKNKIYKDSYLKKEISKIKF